LAKSSKGWTIATLGASQNLEKKINTGRFCAKIGSGHLVLDPPFTANIPEEAAKNQCCQ
jgi:hypothetical protein